MAAAVLAVLFAMGVFSATGVGADVLGGTQKPTVSPTTFEPGEEDVELTVTFQITEAIADAGGANQDVEVTLPSAFVFPTDFDDSTIVVMQGKTEVGAVTRSAQVITIGVDESETDANPNVQPGTVVLTIPGLDTAAATVNLTDAATRIVMVDQEGDTSPTDADPVQVYDPDDALTGLKATVSDSLPGATGVTLTLTFTTAAEEGDAVTITLPPQFNVDTGGSQEADITIALTVGNESANDVSGATDDVATGDTITILDADVDPDAVHTVTIGADLDVTPDPTGGFTNPDAGTYEVSFSQDALIPAGKASFNVNTPPTFVDEDGEDTATYTGLEFFEGGAVQSVQVYVRDVDNLDADGALLDEDERQELLYSAQSNDTSVATANVGTVGGANMVMVTPVGNGDAVVTVTLTDGLGGMDTATFEVTVTESTVVDSDEPGSDQSLTVRGYLDYRDTDNITVKMEDFGVPSSIDADNVVVSVGGMSANPSDVEVSGTTVTLVAPYEAAAVGTATPEKLDATESQLTTITFRRAAGISLPTLHDDYEIEVSTSDTDDDGVDNSVEVRRQVKVSPTSGKRGTEITITAKGYSDNTHDIVMGKGDNSLTKSADATDGELTLKIDTSVKNNDGNSVFQGPDGTETTITVGPAGSDASATFTIDASFTWAPESPTPGQDITITLSDIEPTSSESVDITIGGQDVLNVGDAGDDEDTTWKGQVNGDTPLGNRKIEVSVGKTDLTAQNITVGTNELTVTPTTAVPGQIISIDGDGFTARGTVDLSEVTVDGVQVATETGTTQAINNNGNVSFDIAVPDSVSSGSATVKVVGSGDRIGTASITIAEAEITLSPAESLRGETVTVSGTGFPANDLVLIKYNGGTVNTASTTPTGTFERDITVPARQNINPGGKYEVEAVSQVNDVDVSATEDHEIKAPEISMTPSSAAAGSSISITGSNFKGFLQVHSIVIGGQDVTPVPAPATDKWGSFTASNIQVPQLDATRHAVKVVVGAADGSDGDATEFLTVVTEVESRAPQDIFADLIEAEQLDRIFLYNNETQEWFLYDPDPGFEAANTLDMLNPGNIIWIQLKEAAEVQGTNLLAGWSLITVQ